MRVIRTMDHFVSWLLTDHHYLAFPANDNNALAAIAGLYARQDYEHQNLEGLHD